MSLSREASDTQGSDADDAGSGAAGVQLPPNEKVGVLLLNLGGPETLEDVEPFLYNLFADDSIIRLPPYGALLFFSCTFLSVCVPTQTHHTVASMALGTPAASRFIVLFHLARLACVAQQVWCPAT